MALDTQTDPTRKRRLGLPTGENDTGMSEMGPDDSPSGIEGIVDTDYSISPFAGDTDGSLGVDMSGNDPYADSGVVDPIGPDEGESWLSSGNHHSEPWMNNSPGHPNYASNLRARIAREEWEDYKRRFQPVENELINEAMDLEGGLRSANERAETNMSKAYDQSRGQTGRRNSRYGISMTPDQRESYERKMAMSEAADTAAAKNASRMNYRERRLGIMGGAGRRTATAKSNYGGGG